MKIIRKILAAAALTVVLSACDVVSQASSAYNMTQCEYSYNSISNLTVSGVNFSKGLSLTQLATATSLLNGNAKSIPMNFTLNMDVKNPNMTAASLSGLQYVVNIDDINFTSGALNQAINIASGETQTLPVTIGFDLAEVISNNSKDAVLNIAKNFVGIGSKESKVTVQLKPSFNVGGQTITSPVYIPLSFSFGGK